MAAAQSVRNAIFSCLVALPAMAQLPAGFTSDRKSTRLNSSHPSSCPARRSSDLAVFFPSRSMAISGKFRKKPSRDACPARSVWLQLKPAPRRIHGRRPIRAQRDFFVPRRAPRDGSIARGLHLRSEEHTSELQSPVLLPCTTLFRSRRLFPVEKYGHIGEI